MSGVVTTYPLPTPDGRPFELAVGTDGNIWFTEIEGGQVGRVTPSGVIVVFATPTTHSSPAGITAGPEGALWFAEADGNKIGRIQPSADH
jgi:virginiamycin B lyase